MNEHYEATVKDLGKLWGKYCYGEEDERIDALNALMIKYILYFEYVPTDGKKKREELYLPPSYYYLRSPEDLLGGQFHFYVNKNFISCKIEYVFFGGICEEDKKKILSGEHYHLLKAIFNLIKSEEEQDEADTRNLGFK